MATHSEITQSARKLNKNDFKTLGLSSLGGTLEFYDFIIFVYFTTTISSLFFPNDDEFIKNIKTLSIFAVGYLARPLGGIIMAHFGDTVGRKKMFTLSIFLMAFPTLVIGILPTYEQIGYAAPLLLLLMRILQGAAIGGEMPGAWVFIAEHTPSNRYGFGIGTLTSGITGGIFLGSIVAIIIQRTFTPEEVKDFAWRIPFILGGVFGFISVYLRRFLEETPIFKELASQKRLAKELPLKTVFKNHLAACGLTAIMTWALSTAIVVTILMTPVNILENIHHIPRNFALESNAVATLMLTIGCIFWGYCTDKFGTKNTLIVCWGGLIITAFYFYSSLHPEITLGTLMFNYGLMGFFVGSISTTPILSTRAFPAEIRYSGLSSAYNLAYALFGGLTPLLTAWALDKNVLSAAYYVGFVAVLAIIMGTIPLGYRGYVSKNTKN